MHVFHGPHLARLESAEKGSWAVDPTARAFNSGHAEGLREALRLVRELIREEIAWRLHKAARDKRVRGAGKAP